MTKILCIGEALIDMICTDKGKSLAEGVNFLKKPGGAPTNVAAAIAALGGKADLAAKVGNDPFGRFLVSTMQQLGVDTEFIFRDADYFTTIAYVSLMENGERDFVFSRGADSRLGEEDIVAVPFHDYQIAHFGSATAFLPGPFYNTYRVCREKAIKEGAFISFDPNYRSDLFKSNQSFFISNSLDFIDFAHFCKLSDEEAMLLTASSTVTDASQELMKRTASTFTITLGKEGTLLCHGGKSELVGSIPVVPVDTTGAGDAFVGAILYQLSLKDQSLVKNLDHEQWRAMVYNANKAGARTCEYLGAMEAFSHLNNAIFE